MYSIIFLYSMSVSIKNTVAFGSTIPKRSIMSNILASSMPNAFSVGKNENNMYYSADALKVFCPKFFVGTSKTIRDIITRKNIQETDFIYAIEKTTEWNIMDATSKKAKLLLSKNWVDTHFTVEEQPKIKVVKAKVIKSVIPEIVVDVIPEIVVDVIPEIVVDVIPEIVVVVIPEMVEENIDDVVESDIVDEIIEEAPEIFELTDEEKFKDIDGNVLEIETRGERHEDKIYFKVSDVSKVFDMPRLTTVLLNKEKGYERNVDYKTFNLKGITNGKITNKKRLYLTYNGFLKVINVSRDQSICFTTNNIKSIYKWLANLLDYKQSINNTLVRVNRNTSGFIYIVSSPLIGVVKIGYWTGYESGLYSRYRMVYGQDVILQHKYVEDVREVEKEIHNYFNEYNISGELFEKDKLELYIDYLNELVEIERTIVVDITENIVINNDEDNVDIVDVADENLEEAPEIFELTDEEKFKDVDGNVLQIETRGERHHNKIYFNMTDVSKVFGMHNLRTSLLHKDKGYERNVDYKLFNLKGVPQKGKKTTNKKRLYLTYEGMLRLLFVSRNPNASIFRKWATTIIYTHQMGTDEEREVLGADLMKISLKPFKQMMKGHAGKFPCVYLFELGTVGTLRELYSISSNIPDDTFVYKYGFTDDLPRRFTEHNNDYGKLKGVNVSLSLFTFIEEKYMSEAENDLRQFFNAFDKALPVDKHRELITLNIKELKQIRKQFENLKTEYSGSAHGLQTMIEVLTKKYENEMKEFLHQQKIKEIEHEKEIINKNREYETNDLKHKLDYEKQIGIINCKDLVIENQKMEIKYKDLEVQNKELQLQISLSR